MQEDEVLKIAIAETSMIVRSGLALVLKRIQGLKILPIELVSEESLDECVRFHKPEILIVNRHLPDISMCVNLKKRLRMRV